MAAARRHQADTSSRILDVAERLVQQRGFNGFSYADVAAELDVTTASLHYHFRGKAELGRALIERYAERFASSLEEIDRRGADPPAKLEAYARIYADVLRHQRMCLCGMLAADYETLPKAMRAAVLDFFEQNEAWLVRVLEQGVENGSIELSQPPAAIAHTIVGGLEGAMLIARPRHDVARFEAAAQALLSSLISPRLSASR
jgi:TetR/AcrR family transcriptional regulator, transcriptional repressor for nem operon